MQRIRAHERENQRILPLEESLRTHATRTTALRRIHLQRRDLRRTVLGAGQCLGIARHSQYHSSGSGEQAILAFLVIPSHLICRNDGERGH